MTQACSKVLAHRRPLLALALVAALLAAAALALSPARAANPTSTTWSIGLALADADNDGVYQKGDTPGLLVTITASIQPDADDQSYGGVTAATVAGSNLTFDASTKLNISGGQGIEFQTGTNTQKNVLTGTDLNAKKDGGNAFNCTAGRAAASNGSSPAVATCTIATGIDISIPAVLEDKTYTISGKVQFTDASGDTDDVTATWTEDNGADEDEDTGRGRDTATDELETGERTNSSASVSFAIGIQPAITAVTLTENNICDDRGVVDSDDNTNKVCKTTIPTSHKTQFKLAITNAAGRGVVTGQVAAIVATLVRTGEGSGTATFSDCPGTGAISGRASCSPVLTQTGTAQNPVATDYNTTSEIYEIEAPRTPGTATLRIQVLATAGGSMEQSRDLVFVGPATGISLSDPVSTIINRDTDPSDANESLADRSKGTDSITLTLSAVDARSNTAAHPPQDYTYEITDPDGRRISDDTKITIDQGQKATSGNNANVEDKGKVLIDVTAPASTPLATGLYTATVKRTAQGLSATKMFRVVGPAASLDLEVGDASPSIGSSVAITATVNDADGEAVPDGTTVSFTASNADGTNNDLVILPGGSDNKSGTAMTDDGEATISATVVGNGVVILIATTQGATGTVSDTGEIDTSAAAQSVSATPTSCLSKTDVGDYTTWTCDTTGNADAVFSVLRNRGADALYLRSVGIWVRYATDAAGGPIPGSTNNFTIRQYDTLFIGG